LQEPYFKSILAFTFPTIQFTQLIVQLYLKQLVALQEKEFVLLGLEKKQKCCEQDLFTLKNSIEDLNNELKSFKQKLQREEQNYKNGELQLIADEETLVRQKTQLTSIKKTNDFAAMEIANTSLENRISDQQDALITQLELLESLRKQYALLLQSVNQKIEALKNQQQQLQEQIQELSKAIQQQKEAVETFANTLQGKFYDAYCVLKRSGKAYPLVVAVSESGKCSGCFLSLSTEALSNLKEKQEPQFCEQCGRILYKKEETDEV